MIEEQVKTLSMLYHTILAEQGDVAVVQTLQQAAKDFMITTNSELQRNLDSISFKESADLGKMISGYAFTLGTLKAIEKGEQDIIDINKSLEHIKHSYRYYETKYIREFDYRNKEQREDYINSILLPLMMLIEFLNKKINN